MKKPSDLFDLTIAGIDESWAAFNAERTRRYILTRTWAEWAHPMIFAMCNASYADEVVEDMTIKKCCGFARKHQCGGIIAINASPFISTDPQGLLIEPNLCDEANTRVIIAPGIIAIKRYGQPLKCLGLTKSGEPHHPSRLGYDTPIVAFSDGRSTNA